MKGSYCPVLKEICSLIYQISCLLQEFVKRYSLLFPRKEIKDLREEMPGILESLRLDPCEYQMGKEKVSDC